MSTERTPSDPAPLLDIQNLRIGFKTPFGMTQAVRGVNLRMGRERIAVVGESGSGKSVSFRALLGLLPGSTTVEADRLELQGENLLAMGSWQMRKTRGGRIGMVVQDPKQGLDPAKKIGAQITEMLRLHGKCKTREAKARVQELLADVHIRDPKRVAESYPHQLSGGMAQRAMLAMILSAEPDLLIADEATSALDAVVRHRILDLIDEQVRLRGMGLVLISHDLDLVGGYADRILVMYAGRVMEELKGSRLNQAQHPYTQGLLACRPSIDHPGGELPVLQRDPKWLQ